MSLTRVAVHDAPWSVDFAPQASSDGTVVRLAQLPIGRVGLLHASRRLSHQIVCRIVVCGTPRIGGVSAEMSGKIWFPSASSIRLGPASSVPVFPLRRMK